MSKLRHHHTFCPGSKNHNNKGWGPKHCSLLCWFHVADTQMPQILLSNSKHLGWQRDGFWHLKVWVSELVCSVFKAEEVQSIGKNFFYFTGYINVIELCCLLFHLNSYLMNITDSFFLYTWHTTIVQRFKTIIFSYCLALYWIPVGCKNFKYSQTVPNKQHHMLPHLLCRFSSGLASHFLSRASSWHKPC